jgi:hypothetical protein
MDILLTDITSDGTHGTGNKMNLEGSSSHHVNHHGRSCSCGSQIYKIGVIMEGIDYAGGRPNLKAAWAEGKRFAVRYLYTPTKGVTATEAAAIRAAGLGLVCVYESYAARAKEGQAAGVADGKTAMAWAHVIGLPDNRPVYFAVDFEPTAVDLGHIDAYLKGVAGCLGANRVGVYGSYATVEHCHKSGTARWFWQTYAWSHGQHSAWMHLSQYLNGVAVAGATVDLDRSVQADFGAWMPAAAKPAPVVKQAAPFHMMTAAEMLEMVKNAR